MVWQVLFTVLAAWGLLCALWAGFGWMLSGSRFVTIAVLCPRKNPEGILDRLLWLDGLGLLRCRLIAAIPETAGVHLAQQYEGIEFCTLADLPARLEAEREELD